MVRKVIKENKNKRINEISKQIKNLEKEDCKTIKAKLNKNSELSYLSNIHYLIKETNEYVIDWKIVFVILTPILSALCGFLI